MSDTSGSSHKVLEQLTNIKVGGADSRAEAVVWARE